MTHHETDETADRATRRAGYPGSFGVLRGPLAATRARGIAGLVGAVFACASVGAVFAGPVGAADGVGVTPTRGPRTTRLLDTPMPPPSEDRWVDAPADSDAAAQSAVGSYAANAANANVAAPTAGNATGAAAPPMDPKTRAALAEYYRLQPIDADAAELHLRAELTFSPTAPLAYELGLLEARRAHYSDALAAFDTVIRLAPAYPGAHRNRGLLRARIGDWSGGAKDLRQALQAGGADRDLLRNLAQCDARLARYAAAEGAMRQSLVFQPDDVDGLLLLSTVLHAQARDVEAAAVAEEARRLEPANGRTWLTLAYARLGADQTGPAIDALEGLRAVAPDTAGEWAWTLVVLYLKADLPNDAASLATDLYRDQPATFPADRLLLVLDTLLAQDPSPAPSSSPTSAGAAAAPLVAVLLADHPNDPGVTLRAADVAYRRDQLDDARALAERTLTLDAGSARALLLLGRIHLAQDHPADAIAAFRAARAFPATEIAALREEADLHLLAHAWDDALPILQTLAARDPSRIWGDLVEQVRSLRDHAATPGDNSRAPGFKPSR